MTELPLVVGVDGSEPSLTAVDWAVDEAARRGLPLRLGVPPSVWERYEGGVPSGDQEPPSEQVLAERIVASAAARARQRSAEVRTATDILPQEPVAALLREGDEAFAVVTGTRGRGVIKGAAARLGRADRGRPRPLPGHRRPRGPGRPRGHPRTRPARRGGTGHRRRGRALRLPGRPRRAAASWTRYGPGGARRWRAPAVPCSPGTPRTGTSGRPTSCWRPCCGTWPPAIRGCGSSARRPRVRPGRCSWTVRPPPTSSSWAPGVGAGGAGHRLGRVAHALLHHAPVPGGGQAAALTPVRHRSGRAESGGIGHGGDVGRHRNRPPGTPQTCPRPEE